MTRYTTEEMAEMEALASARERVAAGRERVNAFRETIPAKVEGFMGEWAVADYLGVDRPKVVNPWSGDGGIDLWTRGGETVAVRSRPVGRGGRDLLSPCNRGWPAADWIVLVYVDQPRRTAELVGCITRDRFREVAVVKYLRCDTFVVAPGELIAPEAMRDGRTVAL